MFCSRNAEFIPRSNEVLAKFGFQDALNPLLISGRRDGNQL